MKKQYLGFNTWGNNGTYGRTTTACGLGKMRNTVGSTPRIYNYCNNFAVDPLACTLNLKPTPNSNPTVPNPPTNLSATNGNTEITISFTAGSNGGSAITDYLYSTDGITYISSGYSVSPITITGLTNDVSYTITLKAVNAIGNSIVSSAVSATPNVVLTIETFTTVETTSWTAPYGVTSVDYLLVSGGGGGGGSYDTGAGGGGGGGIVLYGTNYPVIPGTTYTVIVGDGGPGGIGVGNGGGDGTSYPGEVSQFGDIQANGGGAGGGSLTDRSGTGGSQVNVGTLTSPTGGKGGRSPQNVNGGGGGGGMGSAGATATSPTNAAAGGSGITINITGSSVTYGAGGSGGIRNVNANGSSASANTGNGGQGAGSVSSDGSTGGKGGSGIVILKYYT